MIDTPDRAVSIALVAGFSRCGGTMVTTMLAHGGMPTLDPWPYETPGTLASPWSRDLVQRARGCVVKQMEPVDFGPPSDAGPFNVVLLRRTPTEQAKSHRQFLRLVGGIDVPASYVAKLACKLPQLHTQARHQFARWPATRLLLLDFEEVLGDPEDTAKRLVAFVGLPASASAPMAAVVMPRSSQCGPLREPTLMAMFGVEENDD